MSSDREDDTTDPDDHDYNDDDFDELAGVLNDEPSSGEDQEESDGLWADTNENSPPNEEEDEPLTNTQPTDTTPTGNDPEIKTENTHRNDTHSGGEVSSSRTQRKDPNEISVAKDDSDVRDAQEPPTTGNKFVDLIYQHSWPGKNRFERSESPILYTNPHFIAFIHRYLAGVFITSAGLFFAGHYLTGKTNEFLATELPFNIQMSVGWEWLAVCLCIALVGVGIVGYTYISRLHTWFIVTNQRTWVREGILSQRDRGSLNHENVNNVEEKNPARLRLFGVGHVNLFTASTDDVELEMNYMGEPSTWAQTIRTQKQSKLREQNTNTEDTTPSDTND